MISVPLTSIISAASKKPEGYVEACMAAAQLVGNDLVFTPEAFATIRKRFTPTRPIPPDTCVGTALDGDYDEVCSEHHEAELVVADEYYLRTQACRECPCQQQPCPCLRLTRLFKWERCPQDKWPTLIFGDVNLGG